LELPVGVPRNVFSEKTSSPAVGKDPEHLVDEPPIVGVALSASGDAVRLARVARSDEVHAAMKRVRVEGSKVGPDRRAIQGRVFHPRHETGRGVGFPLDVTDSASAGLCDSHAKIQASGAGAQRQREQFIGSEGRYSHVTPPPPARSTARAPASPDRRRRARS
jgi:hypothetical protein